MSTSTEQTHARAGTRADRDTHFEVEQFYYEEAALLDDGPTGRTHGATAGR